MEFGYNLRMPVGSRHQWQLAAAPLVVVLLASGAFSYLSRSDNAGGTPARSSNARTNATERREDPAPTGSTDTPVEGITGHNVRIGPASADQAVPVDLATDLVESLPPAPPLPQPLPLPLNARQPAPAAPIGTIEIERLGVRADLGEGMSLTAIDRGPSHWPGTAAPGQVGNMVVAGHRTTHSHPFRDLDQLVPGDHVVFTTPEGAFTYEVTDIQIISKHDLWISYQGYRHTATLFACHPKGSSRLRIAVNLRLLDAKGKPVDAVVQWRVGSPQFTDALVMIDDWIADIEDDLPPGTTLTHIFIDAESGQTLTLGDAFGDSVDEPSSADPLAGADG